MRLSRFALITPAGVLLAALALIGPSGATAAPTLLAVQQAQVTGATGSQEFFGTSVAISGDTALVGVPHHNNYSGQGRAYVFVRWGSSWSPQAMLTASDGVGGDWFGSSVAISGDTVVVGARNADESYVFTRSGTTWSQEATLAGTGASAVENDTALVGQYVYTRSGTAWSREATLTAADGTLLGSSVALSGDTALMGDRFYDVGANANQGAAFLFTRSGTSWSQEATLTASNGTGDNNFGWSVALSGDTALVGRPAGAGKAYVFTRSGTSWSQQAELIANDAMAYAQFGTSVALSGDTALVGSPWDGGAGVPSVAHGAAYVFTRSGTDWSQQAKLLASDGQGGDWFGYSVALWGSTALVGAPHDAVGSPVSYIEQGSAYVYLLDTSTTIALTTGSASSLAYGAAFAVRGTLTGDGVGLVGRSVILQSAAPGAAYTDTSLTATTTAGGAFAFSVEPTSKTYYRVRFAGATGYAASGPTTSVYATPKAWVRTPIAPTTMYKTRYYTVWGTMMPRHSAGTYPVRIYKYRYVSGKWRSYSYVTAKASNYSTYTKYSRSVRLPYSGKWKVRAYAPADSRHAAAWSSGYDYVNVR